MESGKSFESLDPDVLAHSWQTLNALDSSSRSSGKAAGGVKVAALGLCLLLDLLVVAFVLLEQSVFSFELLVALWRCFLWSETESVVIAGSYTVLDCGDLPLDEALWRPVRLRGSCENSLPWNLTRWELNFLVRPHKTQPGTFITNLNDFHIY